MPNKEYYQEHRDFLIAQARAWQLKNKDKKRQYDKNYRKNNRWANHFDRIKQRCNNPNNNSYKNYGGRGIKCLITLEEIKRLWFRDKAYLLKQPSIDRIDNDGDYTYENCRFIERNENKPHRLRSKTILQFDLEGNFIKKWKSQREASRSFGSYNDNISKCALGYYNHAYGFIWRYKDAK